MTAQAGTRKPVEPHLGVTLPSAPFIQVSPLERWLFLDRWGLFAAVIDGCTADTESVRYLLDSHLPEGIIHCDLRAVQSADPGVADEHGSVTHGQAVAATSKVFTHSVAHDLAGCGVRSPDVPVEFFVQVCGYTKPADRFPTLAAHSLLMVRIRTKQQPNPTRLRQSVRTNHPSVPWMPFPGRFRPYTRPARSIPLYWQASAGAWSAPADVRQHMIDLIQAAGVRGRRPRVSIASSCCITWICSSSSILRSSLSRCSLSCSIWLVWDVSDASR